MSKRKFPLCFTFLALLSCCQGTLVDLEQPFRFSTLTYNIAGLLELLSSAETPRVEATEQISCYINDYDIVNVQEDFNYHDELYFACNDHEYRSRHSGTMGWGSGMNTLSRFPIRRTDQKRWGSCSEADCLTPKGFDMFDVEITPGVSIQVINLHAQAQTNPKPLKSRADNLQQLLDFVDKNNEGQATIIMGDWNSRYTRENEFGLLQEFYARGFKDAWIELIREGEFPQIDAEGLSCSQDDQNSSPNCEVVDKIFYRSSHYISIDPAEYTLRSDAVSEDGHLSDHNPISIEWNLTLNAEYNFSRGVGGFLSGYPFNNLVEVDLRATGGRNPFDEYLLEISVVEADYISGIQLTFSDGIEVKIGQSVTQANSLRTFQLLPSIEPDENNLGSFVVTPERFISGEICSDFSNLFRFSERVYFMELKTSKGRTFQVGTRYSTSNCESFSAPQNFELVGFHGRASENVIDQLGFVFKRNVL